MGIHKSKWAGQLILAPQRVFFCMICKFWGICEGLLLWLTCSTPAGPVLVPNFFYSPCFRNQACPPAGRLALAGPEWNFGWLGKICWLAPNLWVMRGGGQADSFVFFSCSFFLHFSIVGQFVFFFCVSLCVLFWRFWGFPPWKLLDYDKPLAMALISPWDFFLPFFALFFNKILTCEQIIPRGGSSRAEKWTSQRSS